MKQACVIALLMLFCFSCGKNTDPIPNVAVYFQGSLLSPQLNKLQGYGVAVTVAGYGVAGLIIYHELDGSFAAYDRCSSYKPENKCAVTIDSNDLTATDPCSGSKFSLVDGSPVKAPATQSLKEYYTSVSDDVIIVTSN